MLKIGITGNIGSGKTTVSRIFEQIGIPVYDADSHAKSIMIDNTFLVASIKILLGEEAYTADEQLNRAFVAQKVFTDPTLLAKLNALVHPAVFNDFESWFNKQNAPYVLKEAALLYESDSYKTLDKIIVVSANMKLRLQRSITRDASNTAAIEARMKNQMPEEEKVKRADFVIYNNENDLLIPQVLSIHKQILSSV
ncbi:MAG: dephospho-CoA kinase [Bacteroidia bacterium]|nr:dephospho-CoA kinase [Bacteroidia bacterium]